MRRSYDDIRKQSPSEKQNVKYLVCVFVAASGTPKRRTFAHTLRYMYSQ